MKSLLLKILVVVIAIFILISMVRQIFLSISNYYETFILDLAKIERKCDATGIIYKDETVLNFEDENIIKNIHKDGTMIGIDCKIARIYKTKDDALKYEQISILEEDLEDLEQIKEENDMKNLDFIALDRQIDISYDKLLESIFDRKIKNINEERRKLISLLNKKQFIINKKSNFEDSIKKIEDDIEKIESTIEMPKNIISKESGYFVGSTDGLEEKCSVENLDGMSFTEFNEFLKNVNNIKKIDKKNVKIITSPKIFYKAIVPTKDFTKNVRNEHYRIKFKEIGQEVSAYLYDAILKYDEKYGMAIFEIFDMTEKLASLRKSDAEIIIDEFYGFKIPKEAVKVNDKNEPGVYVTDISKMIFKSINIIYEDENFVLCSREPKERDLNYIKNLDRVIVKGKDLYDNKRI